MLTKSLFSAPMAHLHTVTLGGGVEEAKHILTRLQLVEELTDGVKFLASLNVIEKVGLAAHHQDRIFARTLRPTARPARPAAVEIIQLGTLSGDLGADQSCCRRQITSGKCAFR